MILHWLTLVLLLRQLDALSYVTVRCTHFQSNGSQPVSFDAPVRWSGFLERGRPRPLNPPLMQTQPVLVFGLKCEQELFAILDRPRSAKTIQFLLANSKTLFFGHFSPIATILAC
jgi:hypothetical protein